MVTALAVKCPCCKQVLQIYLSVDACVIVMNCPDCQTPIMYFEQKIFMLTRTQVDAIRNSTHDASVMGLLRRIVKTENPADNMMSLVPMVGSSPEKYISRDDITNLRIELQLCKDTRQFIAHL